MSDDEALDDLLDAAAELASFVRGLDLDDFLTDPLRRRGVERMLEILGEAAGRLGPAARERFDVDWAGLRGMRNIIAHQYDAVDPHLAWVAATESVPAMVRAIESAR